MTNSTPGNAFPTKTIADRASVATVSERDFERVGSETVYDGSFPSVRLEHFLYLDRGG